MTRMFIAPGGTERMKTWNVFVGCLHDCTYCSARKMALTRLRHCERYKEGFDPYFVPEELGRRFRNGSWVFIAYMGDICWAGSKALRLIVEKVESMPGVSFLMLTKDPSCYLRWMDEWGFEPTANLYLGATIESNVDHGVSRAPAPVKRYEAMRDVQHAQKFISLEPLMNFHLATLVRWIKEIRPEIVEIGPDNYHNNLPEPYWILPDQKAPQKVRWLLERLREFCPTVVEKPTLSRLLHIS